MNLPTDAFWEKIKYLYILQDRVSDISLPSAV